MNTLKVLLPIILALGIDFRLWRLMGMELTFEWRTVEGIFYLSLPWVSIAFYLLYRVVSFGNEVRKEVSEKASKIGIAERSV
jgi:hypothetical protein